MLSSRGEVNERVAVQVGLEGAGEHIRNVSWLPHSKVKEGLMGSERGALLWLLTS